VADVAVGQGSHTYWGYHGLQALPVWSQGTWEHVNNVQISTLGQEELELQTVL